MGNSSFDGNGSEVARPLNDGVSEVVVCTQFSDGLWWLRTSCVEEQLRFISSVVFVMGRFRVGVWLCPWTCLRNRCWMSSGDRHSLDVLTNA